MRGQFSRRRLLQAGAASALYTGLGIDVSILLGSGAERVEAAPGDQHLPPALLGRSRRLCYNYDAWAPFLKGLSREEIHKNIDMFLGTQVTTIMLSPNVGQSVAYPSRAGEMSHTVEITPDERARIHKAMGETTADAAEGVAQLWKEKHLDPFGLLVERAVAKGFETFASFRMNDVHMVSMREGQGPYTDAFYRQHPEWRVPGSWGLNYAIPEVRRHRLAQLEELIRRYPLDGLELDFHRGLPYFPGEGDAFAGRPGNIAPTPWSPRVARGFPQEFAEASAPIMTEFVREVREMTQRVARERGRRILLAARVPSSLSGCRHGGLDPVAWHRERMLDFLTVGHFLHLFFNLPIAEFKLALPGLKVYASVDYVVGGPRLDGYFYPRDATAEIYRGATSALFAKGADGVYLFNMFACRENGPDPKGKDWTHGEPVEVLKEVGDPSTLEGRDKLYLVDSRFEIFDRPFIDAVATLPQESKPEVPLLVAMTMGEKNPAARAFTLRVVTAKLPQGAIVGLQVNGRSQGKAGQATRPHLFPEAYDQMPPDPAQCVDFAVRGEDLYYGTNEIAVLSSHPIVVNSIELAMGRSLH
jgi:hypothetical protein